MGFPEIPEFKNRPSFKETIVDLLESIAMEEMAISHLLNAEADKIQAFVGKCLNFPSNPSNREIIEFNMSIKQITDTLLMKEWLLLKKLETITNIGKKHQQQDLEPSPRQSNPSLAKKKKNSGGRGQKNEDKEGIPPWDISESISVEWPDEEGEDVSEGEE